MDIICFSDLHGKLPKIPIKYRNDKTVIVLAGDVTNNYPLQTFTPGIKQGILFTPTDWRVWNYRKIDIKKEAELQGQWMEEKLKPHLVSNGINLSNVISINGNHDFVNMENHFETALFSGSKTIIFKGKKIGLLVGVNSIVGEWHDEITENGFENRILKIDRDIEILISHSPCFGVNDGGYGSRELYKAVFGTYGLTPYFTHLKTHISGHVHGKHGVKKFDIDGRKVRFYNCAETRFELTLED